MLVVWRAADIEGDIIQAHSMEWWQGQTVTSATAHLKFRRGKLLMPRELDTKTRLTKKKKPQGHTPSRLPQGVIKKDPLSKSGLWAYESVPRVPLVSELHAVNQRFYTALKLLIGLKQKEHACTAFIDRKPFKWHLGLKESVNGSHTQTHTHMLFLFLCLIAHMVCFYPNHVLNAPSKPWQ